MNKNDKVIVQEFEKYARPVDQVAHIDNKEIINLLKNILKELKVRENINIK
jgi:hypothetical protein